MNKCYSELIKLKTLKERYRYLKLLGIVGEETFGKYRYLNQEFYHSDDWLELRDYAIIRDNGCDLALPDREIMGLVYVHHIVPVTINDILNRTRNLLDPENVICTMKTTHDAIHYGDESKLFVMPSIRQANDTCPWRR